MQLNEVELRQLNNLKQLLVSETPNAQGIPYDKLSQELQSILKNYNDGAEIQQKILQWLRKDESETATSASFERVNNLVEFLQCYPLEVKKNRNASNRMDDILHMRKEDTQKLGGLPPKADLDRASKVLMFLWRKLVDHGKNLSQTFKIMDKKDKGKLKKADFIDGLDKLQIQISKEDGDAAWESLDVQKRGFINFEEFSKIHRSEKQKYMDDPYLSN